MNPSNAKSAARNTYPFEIAFFVIPMCGLVGALIGGFCGLAFGFWMGSGYEPISPSDPADGPIYVAMAISMVSAVVGCVLGGAASVLGFIYVARKRYRRQS